MSFNIDRRTLLASSGLAGIALLAGSGSVFAQAKKELTIATSLPSLEFPFFVHMQKQLIAEGNALGGIKLINMDGQNKAPKQTADVEAAITQKVNAIVISPTDVNAMAPALEAAVKAGIPVVTIDRRVAKVDGHSRPCRRRQREGRRGPGQRHHQGLPERREDHSTCRASPAPARRSTATRACTTSSTR